MRSPKNLVLILGIVSSTPALAFRFEVGDVEGSWANLFTVGGSWRMQDRSTLLVGKSNLDPGLCLDQRCLGFEDAPPTAEQLEYLAAPGIYSINGDDGTLNFDKGDLVAAAAKLTSDLSISYGDYGLFARSYLFFDTLYTDFEEFHPNRATGPRPENREPQTVRWPGEQRSEIGTSFELMDAYVYGSFTLPGEYDVSARLGNNLVNWGESTFLVINSINTINPPLESRIFVPGYDFKEVFQPVPMLFLSTQLTETISAETFYQLSWKGLRTAPPGSFFATSDIGVPGGTFASLPYASNAEDPDQLERIQGAGNLVETFDLTRTSLTILREADREPSDNGQYGLSLKWFSEALGNTELGFYYVNYHSRLPYASATAAYRSCIRPEDPGQQPDQQDFAACNSASNPAITGMSKQERYENSLDLLPLDSVDFFLEYPEDIQLFGVSFNTNFGDVAIQGEYAFRPNLPVQVDLEDLVNAALRPAFPRENEDIGELLFGAPAGVIVPGQDTAVPDLIESRLRGNPDVQPRQYVRGYEELAVGQLSTALTYVFGPGNVIAADQIISLLELGFTQIFDLPGKDRAVFEGPGTDTAPFPGRRELNNQLPTNPEQQARGYVDDFSWGYRVYLQASYKSVLDLFTIEPQLLFFHDIEGVGPGPGANFVEGRREINFSTSVLYGQYRATTGYIWYTGASEYNLRRDRDYATLALRYEF